MTGPSAGKVMARAAPGRPGAARRHRKRSLTMPDRFSTSPAAGRGAREESRGGDQ